MLYLAEVQRKSGFMSGGKAEFKLLACQRGEQSWSSVPGEEIIPAPDDAGYNAGALVMVDLSNNRQVQRHSEAGRQLVTILQNFSNLSKKFKTQEEEIDQWKQSLTFQSQELNRREMELEARQEQVEQAEADIEQIESQRQEVEQSRGEVDRLREELERKTQELDGAWAHLNGEMRRLEERQGELQQQGGLGEAEKQQLQESLNRLTGAIAPTESLREQLNAAFERVDQQQGQLNESLQALEQQREAAQHQQAETDQTAQAIRDRWQAWHEANSTLITTRSELKKCQESLDLKQQQAKALSEQLQDQSNLYQQIYQLLNTSDKVRLGNKVDMAALEAMPIEALEALVSELEKDLEKVSRFVSDQEEELDLQQQAIDDLKSRMEQVSEFDRLQLETELDEEQDRYRMLNETLVGQRRNLLERQEILSQHQALLKRRQGLSTEEAPAVPVDLEPVLNQIEVLRQKTTSDLQTLETETKQLQEKIAELKQQVDQQTTAQTTQREEAQQLETQLQEKRGEVARLFGRLELREELLQPIQEQLGAVRQGLETLSEQVGKFQEASDYQLQAIAEMRQIIHSVAGEQSPELATS
ncbi:pilus motility taxis protein HmpF [Almyronema epifaneia]|uniref:Pilus motility taxis protein HmpF n=1 Tax=Almyronema epifaneia S1 TaxID=2991925 RepID=A0ABW6IE93_9CYAN